MKRLLSQVVLILFFVSAWGAASPGLFSVSDDEVIDAGRQAHDEIIRQYGLWGDLAQQERMERLGRSLARFSSRPEMQYGFYLLDSEVLNALATPDGSIHLTRGLVSQFNDDRELSFFLAHEMAHVEKRHGKRQAEKMMETQAAGSLLLLILGKNDQASRIGMSGAALWLTMKYSRDFEYEADEGGMQLLKQAGIDPHYGPKALAHLFELKKRQPGILDRYFGTHPMPDDRVKRASQVADKLGYVAEAARPTAELKRGDMGTIAGRILVGPIRPVSRAGETNVVAASGREIIIYDKDKRFVGRTRTDRRGYYRMSLRQGSYVVDAGKSGLGFQHVIRDVTLRAGETLQLNFFIDTGIR